MVSRLAAHFASETMPRPSHPKSQLATTIPPILHDALRDFAVATDMPIAKIVEDALRAYLVRAAWPVQE